MHWLLNVRSPEDKCGQLVIWDQRGEHKPVWKALLTNAVERQAVQATSSGGSAETGAESRARSQGRGVKEA